MRESTSMSAVRTNASEVVKRRTVGTNRHALNRRSWPLAPGPSYKQQLKDRERQDQLQEHLSKYSSHGLPPLPELLALGRPKFDESLFQMEAHWKHLVDGHESMAKKQQEHQEAVWELLHTEVSYIKQIRVIIDVFQNCLINLQQETFLNEIETEKLFSNIDSVLECNCMFWREYLVPILHQARDTHLPLNPLLCKEGFVDHFPIMFQVYFKYFIEHKSCLDYAKSCTENSDLFKTFITWAEAQKQCNRFKLTDILVKPMQRLLKYSLLLQAILKHTENESHRNDLKEMIQSVEKLCWSANNSLRRREDYEKLEAVRKTIDLYDAIEAPNDECSKIIQEYNGNFNLLAPMPGFRDGQPRSLIFHSSLRMKEAQAAKLDVDCLLFTDLILICKSNRKMDRFKIIRPPMRLDQLVVSDLKDKGSFLLIYMNEYHVPISAFTFHSDVGAVKGWLEKFREAQREFKMRRVTETAELDRLRSNTIDAQEEVEYTPLNPVSSDTSISSSVFPRSDSVESTDRFMPNLLNPSNVSGDHTHHGTPMELGRSGSAGDIQSQIASPAGFYRDGQNATMPVDATRPSGLSAILQSTPADKLPTSSSHYVTNSVTNHTHKPIETSQSVSNRTVRNASSYSAARLEDSDDFPQQGLILLDEIEITSRSPSQVSLSEQSSIFDEEELSKMKLNARRLSRTEKRYHTADSIQDMKMQDKDSSIHKRLSWRTDVQVDHRSLTSKVLSTDSVRSIPSSSGVSSTGSLHLNPESDITEEVEGGGGSRRDKRLEEDKSNGNTHSKHRNHSSSRVGEGYDGDSDGGDLTADSKQTKSKSTPDLVTMFNSSVRVSELEDGIASVAVTTDGAQRKFTHADILKLKKLKQQILYDANIESSEV